MRNILDLLSEGGHISSSTVLMVNRFCTKWKVTRFHGLLETHIFDQVTLADLLSKLLKMDRVYSIIAQDSGDVAREQFSYKKARLWECFPGSLVEETQNFEIIMADPTEREKIAYIRRIFHNRVNFCVGTLDDILKAIDRHYPIHDQLPFLSDSTILKG